MNRQWNHVAMAGVAVGLLLLYTASAEAYIGPGAGLSLVGALWALIVAVASAVAFIVLWPIRQAMKHRAARKKAVPAVAPSSAAEHAAARETASDAMRATPEAPTH
jgi:type VI protein secretion system component VasK